MELNIVEETKKKLVFEFLDEDHTFCNALKNQLWKDSGVKVASYNIDHPLIGKPTFIVETDGSETPRQALKKAADGLEKEFDKFKDLVKAKVK